MTREQLLGILRSYPRRSEQDVETLSPTAFKLPDRVLVILFASRAGSNFFGELLCRTGHFRAVGESFNPRQLQAVRDRLRLNSLNEAAQWMIDNRGTERAFAFKAALPALEVATRLGFFPEALDRTHFVLLRRRDRVAQAVSKFRMLLSGRLSSKQTERRVVTDDDYDADAIASHMVSIKGAEAAQQDFVSRLRKPAPVFYYEDICSDPVGQVKRACDLLGLELSESFVPSAALSPIRDRLSETWVARFVSSKG